MSKLTDWGENRMIDFYIRNISWALPTAWYVGLASAASDSSITELAGTGYARVPIPRSLTSMSGTQSITSTLVSTGTSHRTTNLSGFTFGTPSVDWGGPATHAVLYDSPTLGNPLLYAEIDGGALPIEIGQEVAFDAGSLLITVGLVGGMSDYLSNKVIDEVFRNGPSFAKPTSLYARLLTASPSNAGGGTEVSAPSYGRVAVVRSNTAWAGTQGAGTTAASTGTGGETSNNTPIVFPTPTSGWGNVSHMALNDAAIAGNLWFWAPMDDTRAVTSISPAPTFLTGSLKLVFN